MKRASATLFVTIVALGFALVRTSNSIGERRAIADSTALLDDGVTRAVVLGDSVAYGAGDETGLGIAGSWDHQLESLGIRASAAINLGINGARTSTVRVLLAREAVRSAIRTADVLIVSIGGNDLYGNASARLLAALWPDHQQEVTLARVDALVRMVRSISPATRIYLLGLYNPYRRASLSGWLDRQVNLWDARLIAHFAAARGVTVVRICDLLQRDERISTMDHFHPGAMGYAAIAARIASSM
ncbi:MAG: GDSL-type esterase/lipase family protein [Thermoanaerobaculia bacterium]